MIWSDIFLQPGRPVSSSLMCFERSQWLRLYQIEVACTAGDQGVCWKWRYLVSPLQIQSDGSQRIDRLNHLGRQPNNRSLVLSVFLVLQPC